MTGWYLAQLADYQYHQQHQYHHNHTQSTHTTTTNIMIQVQKLVEDGDWKELAAIMAPRLEFGTAGIITITIIITIITA